MDVMDKIASKVFKLLKDTACDEIKDDNLQFADHVNEVFERIWKLMEDE